MRFLLNRRRFLVGLSAAAAAGLGSFWLPRWIRGLHRTPDQRWAEFGEAYLALQPDERHPEKLRQLLQGLSDKTLVASTRQDFENGDTVTLLGWVLSRTEGRLLALQYLR